MNEEHRQAESRKHETWAHGHSYWRKSEALGVFVYDGPLGLGYSFCLGDRYIHHANDGLDGWRGSTDNDWHGYSFLEFLGAIAWVRAAEAPGLGCSLWGQQSPALARRALPWLRDEMRRLHDTYGIKGGDIEAEDLAVLISDIEAINSNGGEG